MKQFESIFYYWSLLETDTFLPVNQENNFLIKFRDSLLDKYLFNSVEYAKGITFTDIMSTGDYLLGEVIVFNPELWKMTKANKALLLEPLQTQAVKGFTKDRDDGFLKTYTIESRILITII